LVKGIRFVVMKSRFVMLAVLTLAAAWLACGGTLTPGPAPLAPATVMLATATAPLPTIAWPTMTAIATSEPPAPRATSSYEVPSTEGRRDTGPFDPFGPDRNCTDFAFQHEAQAFYVAAGGPASDRHHLDADGNGRACEDLP
jgi:hypothetical protein